MFSMLDVPDISPGELMALIFGLRQAEAAGVWTFWS